MKLHVHPALRRFRVTGLGFGVGKERFGEEQVARELGVVGMCGEPALALCHVAHGEGVLRPRRVRGEVRLRYTPGLSQVFAG